MLKIYLYALLWDLAENYRTLSEVKTEIFKYLREDDKKLTIDNEQYCNQKVWQSLLPTLRKDQWFISFQHEFCSDTWSPTGILLIKHFGLDQKVSSRNVKIHVMVEIHYKARAAFIFPLWHHLSSVKNYKKKSIFTNYFNLYYYNICIGFKCINTAWKNDWSIWIYLKIFTIFIFKLLAPKILYLLPVPILQDKQMEVSN